MHRPHREWRGGKIDGKGTIYFPNKTSITGTMKGLFSDNSLAVNGTFKHEDDKCDPDL